MDFFAARAISKTNAMHIRRESWAADKWFMLWRGTWFVFGTGLLLPVRATDYTTDDLTAADWTTVPALLAACPISLTSTGGSAPTPGTGTWAFGSGSFPPKPGTGGLGGSPGVGGGGGPLPPPDPGTSVTVTFTGTTCDSYPPVITELSFDGQTYSLEAAGAGVWKTTFTNGKLNSGAPQPWSLTVTRNSPDTVGGPFNYAVDLNASAHPFSATDGGFATDGPGKPVGTPIDNQNLVTESGYVRGGTATVNVG
jgi:hypothetical protein